jgi:proteic killer suppression protein
VITNFKNRKLKRLFEKGDSSGISPEHCNRIKDILARLEIAATPSDVNFPGWRLHPLKGNRKGFWALDVRANWRITFRFEGMDVCDVNYEDYH